KELATDEATTLSVMQHALRVRPANILVLLQPTSPVRDGRLIDVCIRRFQEKNADSLATGFICRYVEYGKNELRRQEIAGFFYDDGNIYINRADLILQGDRYGTRMEKVLVGRD